MDTDKSVKELSCASYERKYVRMNIHLAALDKACVGRRPTTCYTDAAHHTGKTIKYPFTSCSRPSCPFCHSNMRQSRTCHQSDKERRTTQGQRVISNITI